LFIIIINSVLLTTLLKETNPELFTHLFDHDPATISNPVAPGHELRILVAEDNGLNQIVLTKLLGTLGLSCDLASDGIEAVEMFKAGNYEVVLMDMVMPRMGGVEASLAIRAAEIALGRPNRVCIIATTANVTNQDHTLCVQAGMDDFLAKPIRLEVLQGMLHKYQLM